MFKTRSNIYFINNGEIENGNEGLGLGCLKPLSTIETVNEYRYLGTGEKSNYNF
jgi:hypothetical protein